MNAPPKVMLVFGTRPEAIKMAPVYHALRDSSDFQTIACVTAQHRQMLDQVLQTFGVVPDIDLDLMKPEQDLFDVTTSVLMGMRDVFSLHRPDVVLVHGDTTTTLTTSMAAFYAGVPVGHVEAGLRTHNIYAPFPEEFNRQVTSKLTRWHFAPTPFSKQNLLAENVPDENITVTGNTVIDALFWVLDRIEAEFERRSAIVNFLNEHLRFNWRETRFVLVTGHRRENFGDGFLQICEAIKEVADRYPAVHFVYPVHLNPNVQRPVQEILSGLDNVHLVDPLDYEPFVYLLKHSYLVLTDSGGIQEEAPSLGKPVLVMRDVTERPEAVDAGTVRLVGARCQPIVENICELLDNQASYRSMARAHNPYGDGKACARIIKVLKKI
ncbi:MULTISPECIES: non-hydrolyzing UDP-N-acetylglucosamine 2-epimerase [Pseudomonadota]|uniref:non-hydrolyzing UDP-N-acetylglucosamine 2-epimerase n=1 Tax=Shewanella sp. TaxID=50422 RepID=UPI004048B40D